MVNIFLRSEQMHNYYTVSIFFLGNSGPQAQRYSGKLSKPSFPLSLLTHRLKKNFRSPLKSNNGFCFTLFFANIILLHLLWLWHTLDLHMSRRMGKPTICIGKIKGTDQLRSNCEADQRLCSPYTDSSFPLLSKSTHRLIFCHER